MDYWYTVIDDLGERSCSILNASSFMIKAHRFGTMTSTTFFASSYIKAFNMAINGKWDFKHLSQFVLFTLRNPSKVYHCHNYALIL